MNKIIFCTIFTILLVSVSITSGSAQLQIPEWIKNNASWWANGQIDDDSFLQGIRFLINQKIMEIPQTIQGSGSNNIPEWIKNNASW